MSIKIYTDKEKILQYLDLKGVSKNKFYKETGLSNGFLDSGNSFSLENLRLILDKYHDISTEWLLTGKGEMLRSEVQTEVSNEKSYPLLSLEAFAGYGDTEAVGEELARITERYEIPLFRGLNVDFMISVKGSSMYPKYNSGDVVACRLINELTFVQWNKVYVIDTFTQGIILKRLKPSENEKTVICKSDNDSYDAFELPKEEIRKIAMVVGVVRLE